MRDEEYLGFVKSTIVRSLKEPPLVPIARMANRALSALAPALAARLAERLFLTPPRRPRPQVERAILSSARARPLRLGDGSCIETWHWGAGPTVLLVHGWGGRGAQLAAFIDPLIASGFSALGFDAPGHGVSRRRLTTIPQMVAAVRAVAAEHGPIRALIAHSVGGVVATRALYEGLETAAAAFIGPAADLAGPAVQFRETLGFSRRVGELMRERIEQRVGLPWSAFSVSALAPALTVPLLVFHDRGDAEVPWQHGGIIARAWPGAMLQTTDALGHRRILRDPQVIADAVSFLRQHVVAEPAPRRVPEASLAVTSAAGARAPADSEAAPAGGR